VRNRLLLALVAIALAGAGLGLWNSTRTTEAQGGPPGYQLPPQAREVAPNVYFIGSTVVAGRVVDGYAYIHTRPTPQAGKPLGVGGKKGGGSADPSSCYSFTSGRRWNSPEDYIIHPDGVLTADLVNGAVSRWEGAAAIDDIFLAASTSNGPAGDINSMDNLNEVSFGPINDPGVIAVTYTWAYRGPPSVREILEWDMRIDSNLEWGWGITEPNDAFPRGGMNIDSIVTHELGHAAGMGHTDTSTLCQPATMYPYIDFGDASKAILDIGDTTGIAKLYN